MTLISMKSTRALRYLRKNDVPPKPTGCGFRSRAAAPRGFTLVELLIVIAIIALLAAILFPAFSRARENARRTSCASNLKQIALGMMQYSQDYDEGLPLLQLPNTQALRIADGGPHTGSCVSTNTTCVVPHWPDLLDPYIKSAQIFNDPVRVNQYPPGCVWQAGPQAGLPCGTASIPWIYQGRLASTLSQTDAPVSTRTGVGYGYAQNLATTGATLIPRRLAEIAYPSEKLLVAEARNYFTRAPSNNFCGQLSPRHFNGVNTAFVDGHVKWMKWNSVCVDENTSEESKHFWFVNGVDN